jgi:hypothetical protein
MESSRNFLVAEKKTADPIGGRGKIISQRLKRMNTIIQTPLF